MIILVRELKYSAYNEKYDPMAGGAKGILRLVGICIMVYNKNQNLRNEILVFVIVYRCTSFPEAPKANFITSSTVTRL